MVGLRKVPYSLQECRGGCSVPLLRTFSPSVIYHTLSRSSDGSANKYYSEQHNTTMEVVSDIATFVLKRDVKLQLTTMEKDSQENT